MKVISIATTIFLIFGCAKEIRLTTTPPGMEVYAGETKIGLTPLTVEPKALGALNGDGYLVQFRKPGFKKAWLWIPRVLSGIDLSINMAPFQLSDTDSKSAATIDISRKQIYDISNKMLKTQSSLLLGSSENPAELTELTSQYADLGSVQFLQALSMLRQGKSEAAGQALKAAVKLSPREADFLVLSNEVNQKDSKK